MSAGIFYTLGLNSSPLIGALSSAAGALRGFMGSVGSIAGITGGLVGAGGAVLGIKKALSEAANMEGLQTSFEVLLGSAGKAKSRMEDLARFAASTPFELPEVAQASRTLETLTKGALSTGEGLRLVGDVASATQQPFAEIATWIGRLYDGLQSGRPVGEAMARLQELGAISGDVRARIETMQKAGEKGAGVWQEMSGALGGFSGMMDKQSATWNGQMSTLQDSINGVFREFGTPLMDSLKPMLAESIKMADTLGPAARSLGDSFAGALGTARQLFQSGQMGETLGLSLKIGFGEAVNFGAGLIGGLVQAAGSGLGMAVKLMLEDLRAITQPNYWTGIGQALLAAAVAFGAALLRAGADLAEGISRIPGFGAAGGVGAALRARASDATNAAAQLGRGAKEDLAPIAERRASVLKEGLSAMMNGIAESMEKTKVFDVSGFKAKLAEQFETAAKDAHLGDLVRQINEANGARAREDASPARAAADTFSKSMASNADRLQKAGIFIGSSGGPRGQRAAEDTARNTGELVRGQQDLLAEVRKGSRDGGARF